MSAARDYVAVMKTLIEAREKAAAAKVPVILTSSGIEIGRVTQDGGVLFSGKMPGDEIPALVTWLINTFDVPVSDVIVLDTTEPDLLRRKLDRAMETLGEYVRISFDGRSMASRAIAEIEAMQ